MYDDIWYFFYLYLNSEQWQCWKHKSHRNFYGRYIKLFTRSKCQKASMNAFTETVFSWKTLKKDYLTVALLLQHTHLHTKYTSSSAQHLLNNYFMFDHYLWNNVWKDSIILTEILLFLNSSSSLFMFIHMWENSYFFFVSFWMMYHHDKFVYVFFLYFTFKILLFNAHAFEHNLIKKRKKIWFIWKIYEHT
jgi:hypothetical protein